MKTKVKATETLMWGVFYWGVDNQRWERSAHANLFRYTKEKAEEDTLYAEVCCPSLVYKVLPVKIIAEPAPVPDP